MPRKRKKPESSESDDSYEVSSSEREDTDEQQDDDHRPRKPPAKKIKVKIDTDCSANQNSNEKYSKEGYALDEHGNRKRLTPANRRTWRRKVIAVDESELNIPSIDRKTARGGYLATSVHRAKISEANAGSVPWNFGLHRSSTDKAKISVGVRASNRQRLLKQLEQLGMSEEEWLKWKQKIGRLRDNVSRLRCDNRSRKGTYNARLKEYLENQLLKERKKVKPDIDSDNESEKGLQDAELYTILQQEDEQDERIRKVFPREITWRSFSFSADHPESSYAESCPVRGPGGLICCEVCSQRYCTYLSQTMEDLESQRIQRETQEVKETMQLLEGFQKDLGKAVNKTNTVSSRAFRNVSGSRKR